MVETGYDEMEFFSSYYSVTLATLYGQIVTSTSIMFESASLSISLAVIIYWILNLPHAIAYDMVFWPI